MNASEQYSVKSSASAGSGLGNFLRSSFGSLWNKLTGAGYTDAQQQMQDYQTEMSNTAFQRQVADMKAAGLNPALLYGSGAGNGASTPSGADVSGNGSVADMLQIALVGKQAKLLDAQAAKTNVEAGLASRDLAWKDTFNEAQLKEIMSRIGVNEATIETAEYDRALKEAQKILTQTQNRWFGRTAAAQIAANNASAAYQRAEAAISQLEHNLGHRLSSSELLALTDTLLSLVAGNNPLSSSAGKAVVDTVKKYTTPKGYRTSTPEESAGLGGRSASYGNSSWKKVPGSRRSRYSASGGGR